MSVSSAQGGGGAPGSPSKDQLSRFRNKAAPGVRYDSAGAVFSPNEMLHGKQRDKVRSKMHFPGGAAPGGGGDESGGGSAGADAAAPAGGAAASTDAPSLDDAAE